MQTIGSDTGASSTILIGRTFGHAVIADSLFVTDSQRNAILAAHTSNTSFSRVIGSFGEGPVEFSGPANISSNGRVILIQDRNNSRVQLLDNDWRHIATLPARSIAHGEFGISEQYAFVPGRSSSQNLVSAIDLNSLEESVEFLPRLVPTSHSLTSYNRYILGANEGTIIAGYQALPYVFTYSADFNDVEIVKLQSSKFDTLPNPWTVGTLDPDTPSGPLTSLIDDILPTGPESFVLIHRGTAYNICKEANAWKTTSVATLLGLNGLLFQATDVSVQDSVLTASSIFEPVVHRFIWHRPC